MCAPETILLTLKFGEPLRRAVGQRRLQLSMPVNTTLAELLQHLQQHLPGFATAWQQDVVPYAIFHQGRPVTTENHAKTLLHEGDVLYFVMPVCGGCDV